MYAENYNSYHNIASHSDNCGFYTNGSDLWSNYPTHQINDYHQHEAKTQKQPYSDEYFQVPTGFKKLKTTYIEEEQLLTGDYLMCNTSSTFLQSYSSAASLSGSSSSASSGDTALNGPVEYEMGGYCKNKQKRLIANERERNRMHNLNTAFEKLRAVLPTLSSNKQFSKFETLQMAKSYIEALREILLHDAAINNDDNQTKNELGFEQNKIF